MARPYQRKTYDEYDLLYDYGYGDGLEVICTCSTFEEAKSDKKAYIENEGIYPAIRHRRVPYEQKAGAGVGV